MLFEPQPQEGDWLVVQYPILRGITSFVRKLTSFLGYVGSVAMFLMAVIVTIDVSGRFLFDKPFPGSAELVEQLMVCVIYPMLAYVTEKERHIKVDVFINLMERKVPRFLNVVHFIFDILVIFILALLTWEGFVGGLESISSGEVTDILRIPNYPFRFILTAGFAVTFLAMLMKRIVKSFNRK